MPRLLSLAAAQSARLLNVSEIAAPFQLTRPTIRDYITLLERVFLLDVLPPWHSNRISRLVNLAFHSESRTVDSRYAEVTIPASA